MHAAKDWALGQLYCKTGKALWRIEETNEYLLVFTPRTESLALFQFPLNAV
jgi:hypothetical protein